MAGREPEEPPAKKAKKAAEPTELQQKLAAVLKGRNVLLVRHANTGEAEVDHARQLTERGKEQCRRFRDKFAGSLSNLAGLLVSPVQRTTDTAVSIVEGLGLQPTPCEDLYFEDRPWRTQAMRDAEKGLGYAPARDYMEKFPGSHTVAGQKQAEAVLQGAAPLPLGDVMICGHAVYLSFLAFELLSALSLVFKEDPEEQRRWRAQAEAVVMDTNVGEASGFEFTSEGARYLPNPEATDFAAAATNDAFVTGAKDAAAAS